MYFMFSGSSSDVDVGKPTDKQQQAIEDVIQREQALES